MKINLFILNVYHDISKDQIEKVLFKLVRGLNELIESIEVLKQI